MSANKTKKKRNHDTSITSDNPRELPREIVAGFDQLAATLCAIKNAQVIFQPGQEPVIAKMLTRAESWGGWQVIYLPLLPQDCHLNLAVLSTKKFCSWASGWAWNELNDRWVFHSWGYRADKRILFETTMACSMLYYGYRLNHAEMNVRQEAFRHYTADFQAASQLVASSPLLVELGRQSMEIKPMGAGGEPLLQISHSPFRGLI